MGPLLWNQAHNKRRKLKDTSLPINDISIDADPRHKYPFDVMEVGQSFTLLLVERPMVCSNIHAAKKRSKGRDFCIGKIPKGYRIWRIA